MQKLEEIHPTGSSVLLRTDNYNYLYIEQVLMGSVKSVGGLTRGRGFVQSTSLVWLLSMPACAYVNNALQEVTGLTDQSKAKTTRTCTPKTCRAS